ncbi:MAG TPA: FAD-dependent oxidoreductase, partial [Variovorax sp.]
MKTRRRLLQAAGAMALFPGRWFAPEVAAAAEAPAAFSRVRPGAAGWPSQAEWQQLSNAVGGALQVVESPLAACHEAPQSAACAQLFKDLHNPYFLGDEVALTQTLGWVDAWTSMPSVYAVAARHAGDVAAAVNFAREHRLRLVVKGGGHSYQGTSNAADSLLVWTRRMKDIQLHDAFVGAGCAGRAEPVRAVSIGAGAIWAQAYDAVTTQGGGYVQGGGCMTVGVAGLVQSGGFGSFSKAFGLAAASLLEAEVVTADGAVRIANACTNADLFWGLKGGGGGSLGVLTRLTLRVHPLPETFGAVNMTVQATSAAAYRRLVGLVVDFAGRNLVDAHWGEQIHVRPDNVLQVSMVFQGLTRSQAKAVWQPFLDALAAAPEDFKLEFSPFMIVSTSAREFWAPT